MFMYATEPSQQLASLAGCTITLLGGVYRGVLDRSPHSVYHAFVTNFVLIETIHIQCLLINRAMLFIKAL